MRRGKTRMFDRELQKASRFEDAVGFTENPAGFRNIHETHKADGKIKPGIGEWKLDRARDPVVYPQRFFFFRLLRVLDKDFRNIDRCHARATADEKPCIVALTAANIQSREAINSRQKLEKSWCIEVVPKNVVAGSGQCGPHGRVFVPITSGLFVVHGSAIRSGSAPGRRRVNLLNLCAGRRGNR